MFFLFYFELRQKKLQVFSPYNRWNGYQKDKIMSLTTITIFYFRSEDVLVYDNLITKTWKINLISKRFILYHCKFLASVETIGFCVE